MHVWIAPSGLEIDPEPRPCEIPTLENHVDMKNANETLAFEGNGDNFPG